MMVLHRSATEHAPRNEIGNPGSRGPLAGLFLQGIRESASLPAPLSDGSRSDPPEPIPGLPTAGPPDAGVLPRRPRGPESR